MQNHLAAKGGLKSGHRLNHPNPELLHLDTNGMGDRSRLMARSEKGFSIQPFSPA
jgi:hypothetical protein